MPGASEARATRRWVVVPRHELPDLAAWLAQDFLRDAGGGEAFVERATHTLMQALLNPPPPAQHAWNACWRAVMAAHRSRAPIL